MPSKNYTINFVDPNKSTIDILPNSIAGPSGGNRQTDIDLIGMGHSLWGETILENFVHILENFSCEEDIHVITTIPSSSTFVVSGDVTRAFPSGRAFDIWDADNNNGSYVVTSSSYVGLSTDETTVTISVSTLVAGGNLGSAGEIGVPDKALEFSPVTAVQGQLWYNQTRGQLYVYELLAGSPTVGNWKRVGSITFADTTPTAAAEGDLWWETTTYATSADEYGRNLQIYTAGSWVRVAENYLPRDGSKVMQGDLNMDTTWKIVFLSDPTDVATTLPGSITAPRDAVNVGWADFRYVNVTGDTMTGIINMGANKIENLADPDSADDAVNLGYADTRYINASGDAMLGILNMGTNTITGLGSANILAAAGSATDATNVDDARDIVGAVAIGGSNKGIAVSYNSGTKVLSLDLNASITITGDVTGSATPDGSGNYSIDTTHANLNGTGGGIMHDTSQIAGASTITYNGASYYDSASNFVGNALQIVFGGTTKYVPSSSNTCGCTCTCTCTCTCNCNHSKCAKWG